MPTKIVCLDACHLPIPSFAVPPPYSCSYTEYANTPADTATILSRIQDANIVITIRIALTAATISQCSAQLKHIVVVAAGTDTVDLTACKAAGISVSRVPSASSKAVAEHAIALYLAVKRRVVLLHRRTMAGDEWAREGVMVSVFDGFLPKPCSQEMLGMVGYGNLGKRIEKIAEALNMTVLIAERKDAKTIRPGRTEFNTLLRTSDVVIIGIPLDDTSRGLIGEAELRQMQNRPGAILINVARGGVVDEVALMKALREGWIGGAATDVFETEPAKRGESVLLDEPEVDRLNLVVTPHLAWYASSSIRNLQETVKANVEGFIMGRAQNLVV